MLLPGDGALVPEDQENWTPGWAYNEDGYCVDCGHGRWKFHAPWCALADALELLLIHTLSALLCGYSMEERP